MNELAIDLQCDPARGMLVVAGPWSLGESNAVSVRLRVQPADVRLSTGLTAVSGQMPQPEDLARAYAAAVGLLNKTENAVALAVGDITCKLDDRVNGLGLPAELPSRQLEVTVRFVTVASDVLAELVQQVRATGRRIGTLRVVVEEQSRPLALAKAAALGLEPADVANLTLWLDGVAKFIDISKAHLPDLDTGRTLMLQRLSKHTVALRKRFQDFGTADSSPK